MIGDIEVVHLEKFSKLSDMLSNYLINNQHSSYIFLLDSFLASKYYFWFLQITLHIKKKPVF